MPEQTLADHMLAELARRQEEHHRLVAEAEQDQAALVLAQEAAKRSMQAVHVAGQDVQRMQSAISALGYGPPRQQDSSPSNDRQQGATE